MIRVRSTYNIKQSIIDIHEYVKWVKTNQFKAAIIVDTNASSFIAFYNLCVKNNLQPLFGYEKENEYIIFPTNTSSLATFYKVINGDESSFKDLIVYKINSELEFKESLKIIKNFDHEIYNAIFTSEFAHKLVKAKLKLLTCQDYVVDEFLTLNSTYEIISKNYLKTFENDYEKLVKKIQSVLIFKKIILTDVEKQRLNYELKIIRTKKFCSYFLIYVQIIEYLNANQILYGFGRGSASSSFVCYILNITKINPLKYGLIFERFLNLERKEFPDIDLDIDSSKQAEVVKWILKRYDNSALISTFVKLGERNAQKIVNEKFKLPELVLKKLTQKNERNKLIETDASLIGFCNEVDKIKNIIVGTNIHPAGLIISDVDLKSKFPIKDKISGFEFKYLEQLGFVKFDILKLNTLNYVQKTNDLIKKNSLKLKPFSLEDENIFKLVNLLQTKYIFQLDSNLIRSILKKFKVTSFDDLAILISLNRPGTMHLVDEIVKNKNNNGKASNTYGVLLYQEQIMELLISKYELSPQQANNVRIAISKKDDKQMQKIRKYIVLKKMDPKYFDEVKNASSYAFNKAHAYAYARLVMQVLYYKVYYPSEFLITFTDDNMQLNDILYLKYRGIKINGFTKSLKSKLKDKQIQLSLNYLKIDPQIKTFIVESQIQRFMELRNRFENKINENDVKVLIASKIFENNYQTSDKYELTYNKLSSLLRVRKWSKELNKEKWWYTNLQINKIQLEVLGFSFGEVFKTNQYCFVEAVNVLNNMTRGVVLTNYGRLEFLIFEKINFEIGAVYKGEIKVNFYTQDMTLILKNMQKIQTSF